MKSFRSQTSQNIYKTSIEDRNRKWLTKNGFQIVLPSNSYSLKPKYTISK